jgi:hypothetical protein
MQKTLDFWLLWSLSSLEIWSFGRHKPEAGGFCLYLVRLYAELSSLGPLARGKMQDLG